MFGLVLILRRLYFQPDSVSQSLKSNYERCAFCVSDDGEGSDDVDDGHDGDTGSDVVDS